jgi:hypothetical protein
MEKKYFQNLKINSFFEKIKLFVSLMWKLTLGYNIIGLVDMLSLFVIQVVRKDVSFYP